MKLRNYQAMVLSRLWAALYQNTNCLVTLCTGAGKTRIFVELLKIGLERKPDFKALVIVHRVKLVKQTYDVIQSIIGDKCTIFCESLKKKDMSGQIVVSTFQSFQRNTNRHFDLIIVDEAHNITLPLENAIAEMRELNPKLKVVGFTATPFGRDGYIYGTGKFFDEITVSLSMKEIRGLGHICDYTLKSSKDKFDMENVPTPKPSSMNDYLLKDLAELTKDDVKIANQVTDLMERTRDRKRIAVMAINIKHCEKIAYFIRQFEEVITQHSQGPDNIDKYMESDVRFLVSVNQLSEGFDFPEIDCIAFMRPTRSAKFMIQAVGRGLRPHKDKKDCLVLDYGDVFIHCGTPENPVVIEKSYTNKNKTVEPVVKACSECQAYNERKAKVCIDCGKEFKTVFSVDNLNEKPAYDISFIQSPKERIVNFMKFDKDYVTKSGRNVPRVAFYTDHGIIYKWLFTTKQINWFLWQSSGGVNKPKTIKLDDPSKRYPNVELVFNEDI